ncbi:glutamyl-tRNA reductase [Weizmannia acidilactici]|uniref:glutamyl-tRNA reductase n=1 Tax=Weizmannia acidilactici TaxID=2607726 RepID=UPI00124D7516|nr:glutamyl-tRNA reductase [Weizmannia acidilactici]GER66163.1 glutamyl-tRNA reductase [Weizmannia acidilactici]
MRILTVGLNYKSAPVEIRERLSFYEADLAEAMLALQKKKSILENVIVSTCNRTEIYAVADQAHTGRYYIKDFLSQWFQIEKEEFAPYLFVYEDNEAIEHLCKVICGLDSMVLGETQILGQVRDSFLLAQQSKTTGTIFNRLFKDAVTLAKKAHTETEIASNAVSVSYAAVELAKKIFGSMSDKQVLIIGAGKMGELAAENILGSGATNITVINRTYEKAEKLAQRFHGKAFGLSALDTELVSADIVITSTSAKDYVLTAEMLRSAEMKRNGRPLLLVDIAVPRDIDPQAGRLESVFLYDIDDLEGIVEENLKEREKAARQIMGMISDTVVAFNEWVNMLGVVPIITALREKALTIQAETMKSIERKLPDLSERERKLISKHTKSIINQMLKDPILQAKEMAGGPDAARNLELFKKIFNLEEKETADASPEKPMQQAFRPSFSN